MDDRRGSHSFMNLARDWAFLHMCYVLPINALTSLMIIEQVALDPKLGRFCVFTFNFIQLWGRRKKHKYPKSKSLTAWLRRAPQPVVLPKQKYQFLKPPCCAYFAHWCNRGVRGPWLHGLFFWSLLTVESCSVAISILTTHHCSCIYVTFYCCDPIY